MRMRLLRFVALVVISGIIGYTIGISKLSIAWNNYKPTVLLENKEPPPSTQHADFSLFWDVMGRLQTNYYDKTKIDAQKLLHGAITGMVESLEDPYTVYLPPTQNDSFKKGLAGQFEGIGAELGMQNKQIIIVAPLAGSPAEKAGIKAGDAILKVDDQSTAGWTLNQAVTKIRGAKGTEVTLTILHKNDKDSKDIKITRGVITVKSVEGWVKKASEVPKITQTETIKKNKDKKVAYVRLSQFGDTANKDWTSIVNTLDLEIKKQGGVKGIILDLRNNPGGYLTEATFIASEFIKSGVVVSQDKNNGEKMDFSVNRRGLFTDIQVLVLINKGSASASEIVAGALKDHNRAILIGETSFGKGTIQEAEDLGNGAGIHITIAKWLTPNGTWVHEKGLTPDIEIALDEKTPDRDTQLEKAIEELVK